MRYYDASKMRLNNDGIYYMERKINLKGFKYAYISGFYSPTEYSDNLGCYNVRMRVGCNSYLLCETQDKGEAREVINYVQQQVGMNKDVKTYKNAVVDMKYVKDVKLEEENGYKIKIEIENGRTLRVFKSPFKILAQMNFSLVKRDFEKFKQSHLEK